MTNLIQKTGGVMILIALLTGVFYASEAKALNYTFNYSKTKPIVGEDRQVKNFNFTFAPFFQKYKLIKDAGNLYSLNVPDNWVVHKNASPYFYSIYSILGICSPNSGPSSALLIPNGVNLYIHAYDFSKIPIGPSYLNLFIDPIKYLSIYDGIDASTGKRTGLLAVKTIKIDKFQTINYYIVKRNSLDELNHNRITAYMIDNKAKLAYEIEFIYDDTYYKENGEQMFIRLMDSLKFN